MLLLQVPGGRSDQQGLPYARWWGVPIATDPEIDEFSSGKIAKGGDLLFKGQLRRHRLSRQRLLLGSGEGGSPHVRLVRVLLHIPIHRRGFIDTIAGDTNCIRLA